MKTNNFIKAMRWMRNHKKLIIFVITMILIAILASCMGGEGSSATLAVGMLITGVEEARGSYRKAPSDSANCCRASPLTDCNPEVLSISSARFLTVLFCQTICLQKIHLKIWHKLTN